LQESLAKMINVKRGIKWEERGHVRVYEHFKSFMDIKKRSFELKQKMPQHQVQSNKEGKWSRPKVLTEEAGVFDGRWYHHRRHKKYLVWKINVPWYFLENIYHFMLYYVFAWTMCHLL
jgi:hypothetical protein